MARTTTDPKIDRLLASPLGLSRTDATWLASVADEVDVPAGTRVGHSRFTHLVLSGADAGTVVAAGVAPVVLRGAASLLVLTRADARELEARRTARRAPAHVTAPVVRPA